MLLAATLPPYVALNFPTEFTINNDDYVSVSSKNYLGLNQVDSLQEGGTLKLEFCVPSGYTYQNQNGSSDITLTVTPTVSGSDSDFYKKATCTDLNLLDDDSDSDSDGVLDAIDSCPSEVGPDANNGCPWLGFLINEINYDPVTSPEGDANGDGTRSAQGDECIEFYNSGPEIDLAGYTISDADAVRHTFPSGESLIPSNGVLVVFGGPFGGAGDPISDFGGAIVQVANGLDFRLNMNNAGDFMTISDPSGNPILTFDIEPLSENPNESYTRNPDLTGEFEQHAGIQGSGGRLFSPGTKLDGTPFN